jgi:hypothetical protein
MSLCGKVSHAVRAARAGCDVVVAQGTEAGGHTGQVASLALIPQVVDAVEVPVLAAGGLVDGRGLAAALALGAQGVWMGTRFIASHEARAAESFKKRIAEASAEDTTITRCYSGKPMRVLRNAYVADWEEHPEEIALPRADADLRREGRARDGARRGPPRPERACMPTGQGCGGIHVASCAEIVDRVMREAADDRPPRRLPEGPSARRDVVEPEQDQGQVVRLAPVARRRRGHAPARRRRGGAPPLRARSCAHALRDLAWRRLSEAVARAAPCHAARCRIGPISMCMSRAQHVRHQVAVLVVQRLVLVEQAASNANPTGECETLWN